MSTPVLEVRGLAIKLPAGADRVLAVEGIDLKIEAGKTLCVVGESGSGKSMIANAVMGLLPRPHVEPVAGAILFEGEDLLRNEAGLRALRSSRIGMIFRTRCPRSIPSCASASRSPKCLTRMRRCCRGCRRRKSGRE